MPVQPSTVEKLNNRRCVERKSPDPLQPVFGEPYLTHLQIQPCIKWRKDGTTTHESDHPSKGNPSEKAPEKGHGEAHRAGEIPRPHSGKVPRPQNLPRQSPSNAG